MYFARQLFVCRQNHPSLWVVSIGLPSISLLSLKKWTWSNPSIPKEERFERRERTTTHCVAHKSKALGGPKRKKKQRINIYRVFSSKTCSGDYIQCPGKSCFCSKNEQLSIGSPKWTIVFADNNTYFLPPIKNSKD